MQFSEKCAKINIEVERSTQTNYKAHTGGKRYIMDMSISTYYQSTDYQFANTALAKETKAIAKKCATIGKNTLDVARSLRKIRDNKLYQDDFFDGEGNPSFAMYCEDVLNISKSQAYSLIGAANTVDQIKAAEIDLPIENYSVTAISTLGTVGSPEEIKTFCEDHMITETTPIEAIKDAKRATKIKKAKAPAKDKYQYTRSLLTLLNTYRDSLDDNIKEYLDKARKEFNMD